jgi:hypothetical protein
MEDQHMTPQEISRLVWHLKAAIKRYRNWQVSQPGLQEEYASAIVDAEKLIEQLRQKP